MSYVFQGDFSLGALALIKQSSFLIVSEKLEKF